jgi:hypothetical protein
MVTGAADTGQDHAGGQQGLAVPGKGNSVRAKQGKDFHAGIVQCRQLPFLKRLQTI